MVEQVGLKTTKAYVMTTTVKQVKLETTTTEQKSTMAEQAGL